MLANKGLKIVLKVLEDRFGDERMYMNKERQKLVIGPKIGERDHKR